MGTKVKQNGATWEYYALQWTWGILMNLIGVFVFIYALIRKWPIQKHRNAIKIICPPQKAWGGVSFGMFMMVAENSPKSAKHEYGHSIQNMHWGILFPFVIAIPSFVRLWYREFKYNKKGIEPPTKYDDIWFEGEATALGAQAEKEKWDWL